VKNDQRDQRIRDASFYLFGRFEREAEAFATSISVPAMELASRVGALLCHQGQRNDDRLSDLPGGGYRLEAGQGSRALAEMEGTEQPHRGRPRGTASARASSGQATPDQVKPKKKSRFSRKGLAKIRAGIKARWAREKAKAKPKTKSKAKAKKASNDPQKQRIYAARHQAKKEGKPLPPLPRAAAA
jgi:hypothetical protein